MRTRHVLTALTLVLAACSTVPSGRDIGRAIQEQSSVRYSVVDAQPAKFYDQTVLIEATVDAVCQHAGCWMKITDGGKVAIVRWQTGCGGEYTFPADAAGKRVLVQGIVRPKTLSADELEHLDEEAGRKLGVPREGYEITADAVRILDGAR